jgi:hypothetical protein
VDTLRKVLAAGVLLLAPAASWAVRIPLPIEGATLNVTPVVQTQALINENGAPDGQNPSYDIYARRTRIQVSGDVSQYVSYYFQVDNANFGKYGNFTGRMIVQDAWISWAPTGNTGGTVLMVEGGIIFVPSTRGVITSINSQFTVEGHPDLIRGFAAGSFPANRSTGVQLRGWALEKKIGFRGGLYEGVRPSAADPGLNPNSNPMLSGLVNFNILGSQDGSYLYNSIYFSKEPLLSISLSGAYQSRGVRVPKGVADIQTLNSTVYFEYPFSEDTEVIALLTGYRSSVGSGSKDTGFGWGADLGYRWKFVKPYISIEQFTSDDCPTDPSQLSGAALTACNTAATGAHSGDSRNFRAGLDFFINKTLNHVMIELSVNHGQSSWGPQSITAANAGYVPLSLDPLTAGRPRRPINTLLSSPAQRSLLVHWSVAF